MNTELQSKYHNQNQSFQDPCKFLILDNTQIQKQSQKKTLEKRRGRPPKKFEKKQDPFSIKLKKNVKANKTNKKYSQICNIQNQHEKLNELQLQTLKNTIYNVQQVNIYKQTKLGKIIEIINLEHMKMIFVNNGELMKVPVKFQGIEIGQNKPNFQQFVSVLTQVKNFLQNTFTNKIVKVSFDQYDKTGKISVRIMAKTTTQEICLNNWLLQNILSKLKILKSLDYKQQLQNIDPNIVHYE